MSLWLIIDEKEYGPYQRDQVFRMLSAGELPEGAKARREGSDEILSLTEALKQRGTLFTVGQILAQEIHTKAAPVASLTGSHGVGNPCESRATPKPSSTTGRWEGFPPVRMLVAAGVAVFICGILFFTSGDPDEAAHAGASEEPPAAAEVVIAQGPTSGPTDPAPAATVTAHSNAGSLRDDKARTLQLPAAEEVSPNQSFVNTPAPMPASQEATTLSTDTIQQAGETSAGSTSTAQAKVADGVEIRTEKAPPAETLPAASTTIQKVSFAPPSSPARPAVPHSRKDPGVLSEQELITILADRFSSTPVKIYEDEDSWAQEKQSTFKGSFELRTSLEWNPKVKVRYQVPLTAQKRPTPDADNIVLFCTWWKGALPPEPPEKGEPAKASPLDSVMRPISQGLGFTAFSLEIVTDPTDFGNEREAYFHAGPEWVDVVRRAREEIIKRHRLRKKKLLIYGPSQGGTFAARLAVAMPDEVGGVAIQNAPEVSLPVAAARTAWFVSVNAGDSGRQTNMQLVQALKKLGTPCIDVIPPPVYGRRGAGNWYHSLSSQARRSAFLFLDGVARLQNAKGENDVTRWPYMRDQTLPLLIKRNDRQAAQQIPPQRRDYLPTREFVQVLQGMSPPMQIVALEQNDGTWTPCLVGLPPLGRPKGVILLSQKYQVLDYPTLINNMGYLAWQGYLVLVPKMRSQPEVTLQETVGLISRSKILDGLPVSFIGLGDQNDPLWKLLLTQQTIKPAALVPIDFQVSKLLDRTNWPVGAKIDWPLLFLYDQKDYSHSSSAEEAAQAAAKLGELNKFVTAAQHQNQVAAVRFVPLGQKYEERSTQKSIEMAFEFIEASVAGKIRTLYK